MTVVLIAIACGVAAVLYGILTSLQVLKSSAGNERMVAVAQSAAPLRLIEAEPAPDQGGEGTGLGKDAPLLARAWRS